MRVAIVAAGTRGDVHPMLSLGTTLLEAGHAVRLFTSPDFEEAATATGAEFVPLGDSVRSYLDEVAETLHGGTIPLLRQMQRWSERSQAHEMATLPNGMADVDCALAAGTVFLAASVAELYGIPYRYVAYVPSLLPSSAHTPAVFPFQVRARWANRLLWCGASAILNALARRGVNAHRTTLGLGPIADVATHVLSKRPLVAVDRLIAPMPEDCPIANDQIRCLHPFEHEPLPDDLERFLDAGPPPVYLGFGSMTDPDPVRTTAQLLGAIRRLGCRAIIARGWAGIGEGELPDGVMAIDPVSHASLFPRCRVVVHHGGAGTTHTASRAGAPQIVVPHVLDQFYYARRLERLGVAPPPVPRARLDVARLAAAVRDAIEHESLRGRAADLAKRLADLGPVRPSASAVLGAAPA